MVNAFALTNRRENAISDMAPSITERTCRSGASIRLYYHTNGTTRCRTRF